MQYAGQMLPNANPNVTGPLWLPANGAVYPRWFGGAGGNYFARIGWLSGAIGIGLFAVPNVTGWSVLLDDLPGAPDLPPDTPTAGNPPSGTPGVVSINTISGVQPAGAVPVSGIVAPSAAPVQAAPLTDGVTGTFTPMTVTGSNWSGTVACPAGTGRQITARQTNATYFSANSNSFTVV